MSALGETLGILSKVLDGAKIEWYVFGAQAVAVRGAPRATQDIDVTIFASPEQVDSAVEAFRSAGLVHRYPDAAQELMTTSAVLPLASPTGFEVDLVIAGSGLEELALQRATRVRVEDVEVPVAATTDLVVMKVLAGRGKDLEDLRALLAARDADVEEARDLIRQLEEALEQSDLLPVFEQAVRDVFGR